MGVTLISRETLRQRRVGENFATHAQLFQGTARENKAAREPVIRQEFAVPMKNAYWENSEGQQRLYSEIRKLQRRVNEAQTPSNSDLEALLGKVFIDITRRAQEQPDLTSLLATELTNLEFSETINLREIYKYTGKFETIAGTGDQVPLIEQKTGETDSLTVDIVGLGWAESLKNVLFNRLHEMSKVTQAVTDADTDYRNAQVIGQIIDATYDASQKQAADTTSDATFDVLMYNTIRKAIKKLRGLKDYRTEREIAVPSIAILCNSQNTWDLQRVINGQLTNGGATGILTTQNMQALPVQQLIEYDQGITDGYSWGGEDLSFPGVTAGTVYVLVPREYIWVANKRPLTMETGEGDVLSFAQRRMAWYRVQGEWTKVFFGSSYSGTALGSGYGAVVKTTLPSD